MFSTLGKPLFAKMDEFLEKFRRGLVQPICHEFLEKLQYIFLKKERRVGGSKAIRKFSENSSMAFWRKEASLTLVMVCNSCSIVNGVSK